MSLIEEALRRAQDSSQSEQAGSQVVVERAPLPAPQRPVVSPEISRSARQCGVAGEISQEEKPAEEVHHDSAVGSVEGVGGNAAREAHANWPMSALLGVSFFILAGIIAWEVWSYVIPRGSPMPVSARREIHQAMTTGDRAGVAPRPVRRQLELTGVVEGGGEPLAIINGQIMRVGETVDGATLIAVDRNTARLRHRGQEIVLQTNQ